MVAGGGIDRGRLDHRHGDFQDENLKFTLIKSISYRCARCQLCTTVPSCVPQNSRIGFGYFRTEIQIRVSLTDTVNADIAMAVEE